MFSRHLKWTIPLALVSLFFNIIIPSKQTIMYIAASEYGQEVMKNPKVEEITNDSLNLLHTWIKSQTKELNQ